MKGFAFVEAGSASGVERLGAVAWCCGRAGEKYEAEALGCT